MLRFCTHKIVSLTKQNPRFFSEGTEFLQMVENYFDKAGKHTNIRPDLLNFYKRADNVVKFNLTLIRGTLILIQMTGLSKSSQPIDASIKLISYQLKVEQDTHKMLISLRCRLWPP